MRSCAPLFAHGLQVVLVDDTNLTDVRLDLLTRLANSIDAEIQVVDLRNVPIPLCIAQDATRTGTARVGAARIRELAVEAGLT